MKYSCGYWPSKDTTFEQSETEMLSLYCQKAELQDGMKVGSTWQQRRRRESVCGGKHATRRFCAWMMSMVVQGLPTDGHALVCVSRVS